MSTPIPKNYITTGISKTLLTPCRRVGLSRSKKKPKNDNASPLASPLTQTPNRTDITPVKKAEINTYEIETPRINFATKKTDQPILRDTNKNKSKTKKVIPENPNDLDDFSEPVKTILNTNKNECRKISPTQDVPTKTIVTVEVHHPVAKRNIFNTLTKSSGINNKLPTFPIKDRKNTIDPTEKTADIPKNKKRKLSIDSDDFAENKNTVRSKKLAEKISIFEKNTKTSSVLSNDSSGITLARFTTDDYLKEYTTNPKMFQENLERESLESATTNEVYTNDIKAFETASCNTSDQNDEQNNSKSKISLLKKSVNILCSPNYNNSKKVQRSLSLKKQTKEPKSTLQQSSAAQDITPKSKLTVSVERLNTENLKSKQKNAEISNIQIKKTFLNVSSVKCKLKYSKVNIDDDDEELFTSSPEDEKKQRENLVQLISDIEIEIKQKEEKLEKLKQAEVYKKKHSPEKVKISSNKWLEGCRAGLDDLLAKMQEHGPMEMDTLVKKLGIPDNILNCLRIS